MLDQTRTAKEKETRKTKDEPEKVVKQWEQERQPEGVLSKETLGVTDLFTVLTVLIISQIYMYLYYI